MIDMGKVDEILVKVRAEIVRAVAKHPNPYHSPHEGHSIIEEELDELFDEVKANRGRLEDYGLKEALHVAATGVRYIADLS